MFTAKVKRVPPVISTERLMQGSACFKCRTEMLRLALSQEHAFGENQEEVCGIKNNFFSLTKPTHTYVDVFTFVWFPSFFVQRCSWMKKKKEVKSGYNAGPLKKVLDFGRFFSQVNTPAHYKLKKHCSKKSNLL